MWWRMVYTVKMLLPFMCSCFNWYQHLLLLYMWNSPTQVNPSPWNPLRHSQPYCNSPTRTQLARGWHSSHTANTSVNSYLIKLAIVTPFYDVCTLYYIERSKTFCFWQFLLWYLPSQIGSSEDHTPSSVHTLDSAPSSRKLSGSHE